MYNGSSRVLYNSTTEQITIMEDHERIDYVLVRKVKEIESDEVLAFEDKLKNYFILSKVYEKGKVFIKIIVTEEILKEYCEVLKLHLPLKEKGKDYTNERNGPIKKLYKRIIHFGLSEKIFPDSEYQLMEVFSRANIDFFNTSDSVFFTPAIKSIIVHHILYKIADISSLENTEYEATYPIHDETTLTRLCDNWASLINLQNYLKLQPLEEIKDYLGIKIALYYAWMSFYSRMLISASIIGVLFLFYGFVTFRFRHYKFEICNADYIMCPLCDKYCDYWKINESCLYSSITYVFDNSSTVFFTCLMTLWIVIYSNLWKRQTVIIKHRWGLNSSLYENDNFETKLNRVPRIVFSFMIVLFLIFILIALTLSLIFYRIAITASEKIFSEELTSSKKFTITLIGSILEFIFICLMNKIFTKIAVWLTDRENHRTRANLEFHLAWKMFLFGFVNYYSPLFYIAFIKGRFGGHPQKHIKLFGYRQEECDPGGCMLELFIQAGVIMVGELTIYNITENLEPYIKRKYRCSKNMAATSHSDIPQEDRLLEMGQEHYYSKEFDLLEWKSTDIIEDYLEMVLQYGLVTLFFAAFPLAPFFALINNIIEMRLDAKRLLTNYRRPVAENDNSIGIWLWFMDLLAKCAVLSNACIIAFTSNYIPQLVYTLTISPNRTAAGFLNHSLSYFDVQDFENDTMPKTTNVTQCRYPDYRYPPGHEKQYELTMFYWHVLVARLVFVIAFIVVIIVLKMLWECLVPEMTPKLRKHISHETEHAKAITC